MPEHPPPARADRRGARRLAGLRAIVTGASSGVGRAVVRELSRRGCRCLATARREERLDALAQEALAEGRPPILVLAGDITAADTRRRLLATARDSLGGLDLVVTAAGCGAIGSFRDADPATLRTVMELDFFAPAELVRGSLDLLAGSADPAVVFVGSILGLHPLPLHADYCAAKAALRCLAGALRAELAPGGIDVVLASLGPTESEFWETLVAGTRPAWSRGTPMSAEAAARAIVAAIEHRRPEVLPGWSAKGYAIAARLCPWLIDAFVARRQRADA